MREIDQRLFAAVEAGNLAEMDALIKTGADVNSKGGGHTPLHEAAHCGTHEAIVLLIQNRADVNAKDRDGSTPLSWAYYFGNRKAIDLLLQHGADVNAKNRDGKTPLLSAVVSGMLGDIELLVKYGADVNAKDIDGKAPLHWAVYIGKIEAIALLIKYGADVNAKGEYNMTPLHWAAAEGSLEAATLLLKHGADALAKSQGGQTPLDIAKDNKHQHLYPILEAAMARQTTAPSKELKSVEAQVQLLADKYQQLLVLQSQQVTNNPAISALQQQIKVQEEKMEVVTARLTEHEQALAAAKQMQAQFTVYEGFLKEVMAKRQQKDNIARSPAHAAYVGTYQEVMHATYFAALVTRTELVALENRGGVATAGKIVGVIGEMASNMVPAFGTAVNIGAQIGKAVLMHSADKKQRGQLAKLSELRPNPMDWCLAVEEAAQQIIGKKGKKVADLKEVEQGTGIQAKVTGWFNMVKGWLSALPNQTVVQRYAAEDAMAGLELIMNGKVANASNLVASLVACAVKEEVSTAVPTSQPLQAAIPGPSSQNQMQMMQEMLRATQDQLALTRRQLQAQANATEQLGKRFEDLVVTTPLSQTEKLAKQAQDRTGAVAMPGGLNA